MSAAPDDRAATLLSYVPQLLVQRAIRAPAAPTDVEVESFSAAILFADISGFTALAESLSNQGREGIETLGAELNAYFGPLVTIITAQGGDIVKFAGDAVLALWRTDSEAELPIALARAAACADAIEARLEDHRTAEGRPLRLKMTLGAGELSAFHVGGQLNRWELVITGSPLVRVGWAASGAAPGQPSIFSQDAEAYGAHLETAPLDGRVSRITGLKAAPPSAPVNAVPELSAAAQEALRAWIPGAIRNHAQAHSNAWLGELRRLTVVFAILPGHDAALTPAQAQRFMLKIQEITYRYEGSVNKLSLDEKGISLLAGFGLPPFAHADDPTRGLRAALELSAAFRELGWEGAVGVASGRAYCGVIGGPERCEYTVIGRVVNLAARLMSQAQGTVLCDAATRDATGPGMSFEELPPLRLKGLEEPVPAFRPRLEAAAEAPVSRDVTVVGREEERRLARGLIAEVEGRGQALLLLEGDPGIGKSCLAEAIFEDARAAGLRVLRGHGDGIESRTPFFAWRALLRGLLDLDRARDLADQRRLVTEMLRELGEEAARKAPLLEPILGIGLEDNEATASLQGEARSTNRQELVAELLAYEAAQTPIILSIEDLHWLDSASRMLLRALAGQVPGVLWLVTSRPERTEERADELAELTDIPGAHRRLLQELSAAEAIELVRLRLGVESIPSPVADLVTLRSGGNPFFAEELALALREERAFLGVETSGEIDPAALEGLTLPDRVEGVVTQRIDRLSPTQQLLLKVASVLGRLFPLRLLRAIIPVADVRESLDEDLRALESHDLISQQAPEPDRSYIFRHAITHEVAYGLMLGRQREELHLAAAEAITRTTVGREPPWPLLAHHWQRAGQVSRAVACLEAAGEQAIRGFANEEALAFFGRAEALMRELPPGERERFAPRRASWSQHMGEAAYALGRADEARRRFDEAMRLRGQGVASGAVSRGLSLMGALSRQALSLLRRPAVDATRRRDHLDEAQLHERLGQICYMDSDRTGTLTSSLRALNSAERAGPSPELARACANVAVCCQIARLLPLCQTYKRRALETARSLNDPPSLSYVCEVVGIFHVGEGEFEDAVPLLDEAIALAEAAGDHRRWDESVFTLGLGATRAGELGRAFEAFSTLASEGARRRIPQVQLWGLSGKTGVSLLDGEAPETGELTALLAGSADDARILTADWVYGYGWLAQAEAQGKRAEAANAAIAEVVERMRGTAITGHYIFEGIAGALEALVLMQATRAPAWRPLEGSLRAFLRSYPCGRPRGLRLLAEAAKQRGQRGAARRLAKRALKAAEGQSAKREVKRARALLEAE